MGSETVSLDRALEVHMAPRVWVCMSRGLLPVAWVSLHVDRTAASGMGGCACRQDCCRCRGWVRMLTGLLPVAWVGLSG